MTANASKPLNSPVFEIDRTFKAPLERVWNAWSQAGQIEHWWGPKGCSITLQRFEFKPGGFFHYAMDFAGAPSTFGRFNYREIVPRERIVWLNSFANESCGITRAPFSELCPLEIENSVTFQERAGTTTVLLRAQPFGATAAEQQWFDDLRASLEEGYGGTCERLGDYLAKA